MKKLFATLVAMMAIVTAFPQTNQKPYSYKSAYIEYELTGNTTGKQTLYIDNWGWNRSETTHSVTKMLGQKLETHQRNLTIQFDSYQWVPGDKKGTKLHNQWLEDLLADPNFDMKEFSDKTLEGLGFVKAGKETVSGKVCDVWKSNLGSTSWVWNNIAVKTEVKLLGTTQVMTATKIEIDASIPAGEFDLPSDVKFKETVMDPGEINFDNMPEEANDSAETEDNPVKGLKDLKGLMKKLKTE
jgi:hypothetical protein